MKYQKNIKRIYILLAILFIGAIINGCDYSDRQPGQNLLNTTQPPSTYLPSVIIDDQMYYFCGYKIGDIEIGESDIAGTIMSTVPLSSRPTKNDEANFNVQDMPYAKYEKGYVVFWNDEWSYFVKIDDL